MFCSNCGKPMREVKHTAYPYYDWRCDDCKAHFEMSTSTEIKGDKCSN